MDPSLTAVGQLRALARSQKRPVRTVNMFDCDVCTGLDLREALENTPPPPDRLRYEVRVQVAERRFAVRANDCYLAIEVVGDFSALANLLEGEWGRRVELVTFESLSPYLGPRLLAEAEDVLRAA